VVPRSMPMIFLEAIVLLLSVLSHPAESAACGRGLSPQVILPQNPCHSRSALQHGLQEAQNIHFSGFCRGIQAAAFIRGCHSDRSRRTTDIRTAVLAILSGCDLFFWRPFSWLCGTLRRKRLPVSFPPEEPSGCFAEMTPGVFFASAEPLFASPEKQVTPMGKLLQGKRLTRVNPASYKSPHEPWVPS